MIGKKKSKLWEWQLKCKEPGQKCAKCPETRHLTVDHIVPVVFIRQFLIPDLPPEWEMEENFQILCRYCNAFKRDTIDPRDPKVYEILEKIIKQAKEFHLKNVI